MKVLSLGSDGNQDRRRMYPCVNAYVLIPHYLAFFLISGQSHRSMWMIPRGRSALFRSMPMGTTRKWNLPILRGQNLPWLYPYQYNAINIPTRHDVAFLGTTSHVTSSCIWLLAPKSISPYSPPTFCAFKFQKLVTRTGWFVSAILYKAWLTHSHVELKHMSIPELLLLHTSSSSVRYFGRWCTP